MKIWLSDTCFRSYLFFWELHVMEGGGQSCRPLFRLSVFPFWTRKSPCSFTPCPSRLTRLLGQHGESVAATYHAKLFVTNDTYWHLLVWHPVLLFWWHDWRNIQLLTTLNRGLLCTQAPAGRRGRSWSLSSQQSRIKRNLSSWNGVSFPLQASGRRLPPSSFLHWCRRCRREAPRLRNGRYSTRHRSHGRSRRGRGSLDQTLHDAAAKFCRGWKLCFQYYKSDCSLHF